MKNPGKKEVLFSAIKVVSILLLMGHSALSQSGENGKIKEYWKTNQGPIIKEFLSFLSIPNVASDTVNIRLNAEFIKEMMIKRNISNVKLLDGKTKGVHPSVYGEVIVPGAKQTLIFYAHYDGQPVNPGQWAEGLKPFVPKLFSNSMAKNGSAISLPAAGASYDPEWRIYARGASDDKAGVVTILNAYDAIVKNKTKLKYNLKFFFEGEEEAGSPHLDEILQKHAALLKSDLWIICDGPVHQSGKKIISFGVRGDAHVELTVYGPVRPLHSGHYGNWAPNPAMMLAKLLSSMKNDSGLVTIEGFYDDVQPLGEQELKALEEMPDFDQQIKDELGLAAVEMPGKSLSESINFPSLNINGMQSANVGKMSSNIIPTVAQAVIDLRLVLGNDWKKQQQKVIDHISKQGFHVIDHDPTDEERKQFPKLIKAIAGNNGYNAQRTSMSHPVAIKVAEAVRTTTTEQVVLIPTSGGSLPLYLIEKYLKTNAISVPIANHDNNQHAENENIRISNLMTGIETMASVMSMK